MSSVEALQETEIDVWVAPVAATFCGAEGGCVSGQLFVCASTELVVELRLPSALYLRISKRYLEPQSSPSTVAEVSVVETTLGAAAATPTSKKANRKTSFFTRHLRGEVWGGRTASTVSPASQEAVNREEKFLNRTPRQKLTTQTSISR